MRRSRKRVNQSPDGAPPLPIYGCASLPWFHPARFLAPLGSGSMHYEKARPASEARGCDGAPPPLRCAGLRSIPKSCYSAPFTPEYLISCPLSCARRSSPFFCSFRCKLIAFGDDTKQPAISPELAAADQLYRAGKFAEAEASLSGATQDRFEAGACAIGGCSSWSCAGMLRQQKIDEALDAVNTALDRAAQFGGVAGGERRCPVSSR